jgi:ketosteroid isomerase-like protein
VPATALDATDFSRDWVQAWNSHDVEAVLRHFHDDVVFTSPVAARLLPHARRRLFSSVRAR